MMFEDYQRARRLLMRRDPVLSQLIKRVGPCHMGARQRPDHLSALVAAVTSQQLSTKAAATIYGRLTELFPERVLTAEGIAALDDSSLRGAGLSTQKVSYLRDLSARLLDGRLRLERLSVLADEDVVTCLTTVKGFGRWTAEMFLMFRLSRPDVLPVGDLGIVKAVQRLYGLRKPPEARRLQEIGQRWRPYRSVACWYLWQSLTLEPLRATNVRTRSSGLVPSRRAVR